MTRIDNNIMKGNVETDQQKLVISFVMLQLAQS